MPLQSVGPAMFGESTREIYHVVNDVLSKGAEGALYFIVQGLFLGQCVGHSLKIEGDEETASLIRRLLADRTCLETHRVQRSVNQVCLHSSSHLVVVLQRGVAGLRAICCIEGLVSEFKGGVARAARLI